MCLLQTDSAKRSKGENQRYCGAKPCQRARKSKWQREKQKMDPDYRLTERESQRAWQRKNPFYWRQYRKKKPSYCELNRRLQQTRDRAKRQAATTNEHLAKMDALPVKIIPITTT